MGLWVPPTVSPRLREETARREAEAEQGLIDQRWAWVERFNRDLENIWPGLRLKWCPDPAPVDAVAMGAKPGRWGILMPGVNGGPSSVKAIVGPDGCFVDPSVNASAIFDSLREQDWWNPQVRAERERVAEEARKAAERRKEQEREEANQEVLERFLAGTRAQVSMSRDVPWSQNHAGRKAARKR